jgi:hypothetical protein
MSCSGINHACCTAFADCPHSPPTHVALSDRLCPRTDRARLVQVGRADNRSLWWSAATKVPLAGRGNMQPLIENELVPETVDDLKGTGSVQRRVPRNLRLTITTSIGSGEWAR